MVDAIGMARESSRAVAVIERRPRRIAAVGKSRKDIHQIVEGWLLKVVVFAGEWRIDCDIVVLPIIQEHDMTSGFVSVFAVAMKVIGCGLVVLCTGPGSSAPAGGGEGSPAIRVIKRPSASRILLMRCGPRSSAPGENPRP